MTDKIGNVNMAESNKKKKAAGALDIPEDDFSRTARAPQDKAGGKKGASKKAKAGGTPSSGALRAPASPQGEAFSKAQEEKKGKVKPAEDGKKGASNKAKAGGAPSSGALRAPASPCGEAFSKAQEEKKGKVKPAEDGKKGASRKAKAGEAPSSGALRAPASPRGEAFSKAQEEKKGKVKAQKKAKAPKKKRKGKKKLSPTLLAANLLLAAGIAVFVMLGGMLVVRHNSFAEMKRVVEAQTFYDGTTVEGVDVSEMTLRQALAYWQENIEPRYADRVVTLDGAGQVTAVDMGYQSDYEAVLFNAWSAGRRGSLEQRYHAAVSRQYKPVAYEVDRDLYTEKAVNNYVQAVAVKADVPAVDAAIESFDVNTYNFVLTESREGRQLDADSLKRDIIAALEAGGGAVSLNIETVQPRVTQAEVSSEYGMIAYAVTNASSSSTNRINNIKNAVSIINGTRVADGETFSFNDTVGKRTTDRGFRRATAYSSGEVTEEIGGGICQVSTTLFNAAVKADMEIVERHNHSLTVSYVDRGKDAAVNWNSQDLKFTNHSGDDVYICCFVTEDKRVRFGIFGRLLPNGETITLEGRTTETVKYDTKYEYSGFLMPGETKVVEKGKNGYKAEAYKIRWDAQGNQLSKELLCKSSYKSRNEVIQFGK